MSVFVFLRYTLLLIKLSFKNKVLFYVSISMVNLMFVWYLFKVPSTLLMEVNFSKQKVPSTYLFHNNMSLHIVGIIFRWSSTIKMFAKTGPSGEPIATPSTWRLVLLLKMKCTFSVYRYSNSLILFFSISVFISF